MAILLPVAARHDAKPRHGADRRQRLAAKAEGGDADQRLIGQLRGGMALHRQVELVGIHPAAVVADPDQVRPPP